MTYDTRKSMDDLTVWSAITTHLAPLHKIVKQMIADLDQPGLPL